MILSINNRQWWWLPISILAGFFPLSIPAAVNGTFYTVMGIVFCTGFSLIISTSYKDVGDRYSRGRLRVNLQTMRERFVFYFCVATVFCLLSILCKRDFFIEILESSNKLDVRVKEVLLYIINIYHLSFTALVVYIVVLCVFIRSYNNLQKLNEDIDEELSK